jgi:hypothetical protein
VLYAEIVDPRWRRHDPRNVDHIVPSACAGCSNVDHTAASAPLRVALATVRFHDHRGAALAQWRLMDETNPEPERRQSDRRQGDRRQAPTEGAERVAKQWAAAWSTRDLGALFQLMAAGIAIESNLDPDGDFVEVMCDLAAAVDRIDVVSEVVAPDGQVALIYDCPGPAGTVRIAEFLSVRDGLVTSVRRVYDVVAAQRALAR